MFIQLHKYRSAVSRTLVPLFTHRDSIPVDIETKCANTVGRAKKKTSMRQNRNLKTASSWARETFSYMFRYFATEHFSAIRTESMLVSINKWCFIKSHWLLLMLHCRWYECRSHRNEDGRAGDKKKTPTNVKSILLAHRVAWMHKMLTAVEGIGIGIEKRYRTIVESIVSSQSFATSQNVDSVPLCALATMSKYYAEAVKWPLGTISFIFIYYYCSAWVELRVGAAAPLPT